LGRGGEKDGKPGFLFWAGYGRGQDVCRYQWVSKSYPQIEPAVVTRSDLLDVCFEHCRKMAPLQQWLVQVAES